MIEIPKAILDEAAKQVGIKPAIFVDIWAEKGPETRIDTRSQWSGINDPMQAADVNMSYTRKPGSIILAEGSGVSSVYTVPDLSPDVIIWKGSVGDRWWDWTFYGATKPIYWHQNWVRTLIQADRYKEIPFVAKSTQVLNEIKMRSQNKGNLTKSCWVRIIDATGKQVGNVARWTPTGTLQTHTVSGLSATLIRSQAYYLQYGYDGIDLNALPGVKRNSNYVYTFALYVHPYTVSNPAFEIPIRDGGYSTGGFEGYQSTGHITRQMDVGSVPTSEGVVSFSDIVPAGTISTVEMFYTDDPARLTDTDNSLWTSIGLVASGDKISAHRYWRALITFTANQGGDFTPEISEIRVSFRPAPLTFGTHAKNEFASVTGYDTPWALPFVATESKTIVGTTIPAVVSITSASAQLSPKVNSSMIGKMTIIFAPEPEVRSLFGYNLRGKEVAVRIGYDGVEETFVLYRGIVEDIDHSKLRYALRLEDDFKISQVRMPLAKAGNVWSATEAYSVGNVVVYGSNSWICTVAVGPSATPPPSDATHWSLNGTVWEPVEYTTTTGGGVRWHLADIAKDILANRINIPSERIDFESIDLIKSLRPNRTGERSLTKPTDANEALAELSWLLEAQFIPRGRQIALVAEPLSTDEPIFAITDDHIRDGLAMRKGWKDMFNQILIFTGYQGDGSGDDKFDEGQSYTDAQSVIDFDMTSTKVFYDKWNVPTLPTSFATPPASWAVSTPYAVGDFVDHNGEFFQCKAAHTSSAADEPRVGANWASYWDSNELLKRAESFVNSFKDGRKVVTFSAYMTLAGLEPGDLVTVQSIEFPIGDEGPHRMMVVRKDIDHENQRLNFTLLGVA